MNLDKSKYSWMAGWVSELEPGQAYRAEKGVEYDCMSESFRNVVYTVAREKGWKATATVFPEFVVFAFFKPTSYMRPNLPAYPIVRKLKGEQA